ncbi:MAG: hypothetical protein ACYS17_11625 [Planctomycetota bacterium]|jgi:hypothetical protein
MRDFVDQNDCLPTQERRLWYRCNVGMAMVVGVMFIAICVMSTMDVTWPADSASNVNVIMSGENFAKYGFMRLHFLPVQHVGPISDSPWYYLHYPPLPNIINGLLQKAGVRSLFWMRVFCGTFFIIGSVCLYRGLGRVIGPFGAVCGLGFLTTTLFFSRFTISLHQHDYNMFFLGMFFLLFLRAIHSEKPKKGSWLGCWLILFFSSLTSFEFILYPQVFALIYVLATGQFRRRWRLLVVLAAAPLAGVGLHFVQNCWAVGLSTALADNLGFTKRDFGGLAQRFGIMMKVPKMVLQRSSTYFYFSWPAISALAVVIFALRQKICPKMSRHVGALLLAVLVSPVAWYLLMPSHTVRHTHIMNQLLPLVVVVIGSAISVMLSVLLRKDSTAWGRLLAGAVLLALALNQLYVIKPKLNERTRFTDMTLLKAIGPNGLPQKAGFLFNRDFKVGPHFSYITRRPAWYPGFGSSLPAVSVIGVEQDEPRVRGWLNNTLPGPDFLRVLQKCVPEDWPIRYLVFLGKGDYTNNELFRALAVNCLGKKKEFNLPGQDTPAALILFDISPLHLWEDQRPALDPQVQQKQLGGTFAQWDIPGFDQRLKRLRNAYGCTDDRTPAPSM